MSRLMRWCVPDDAFWSLEDRENVEDERLLIVAMVRWGMVG